MDKDLSLTLAFVDHKPLAAGRALATTSAADAAAFLGAIPPRQAASALAAMEPWSASEALARMSTVSAAALLRRLDYLNAAAILRNLPAGIRKNVLAELPHKLRRDFEISLVFPAGTVGAHMTTMYMTISDEHVAEDAIKLIQRSAVGQSDVILIVSENRMLGGAVTASTLLRYPGSTPLTNIMDKDIDTISTRSPLAESQDLPSWDRYTALPVLSRQQHVVGLLHRKTLTHVAQRSTPSLQQGAGTPIPIAMLDAFVASTLGLARVLSGAQASATSEPRTDDG